MISLRFCLVWFGLFVHRFSHTYTYNTVHANYSLQFIYYNTTYNIWAFTQYNIINNNTKFKGQLEVESVTTSRYMCVNINISELRIHIESNNVEYYWVILHVGLFRCLLLECLHWAKISIGIPSKIFLQWVKWICKKETLWSRS